MPILYSLFFIIIGVGVSSLIIIIIEYYIIIIFMKECNGGSVVKR